MRGTGEDVKPLHVIHDVGAAWLLPTFHDLLGTGVVHLFLGGVGGEHAIKGKGLPLWRAQTSWVRTLQSFKHFKLIEK